MTDFSNSVVFQNKDASTAFISTIIVLNHMLLINYVLYLVTVIVFKKDFSGSYYILTHALAFCDIVILMISLGLIGSRLFMADLNRLTFRKYLTFINIGFGYFPSEFLNIFIAINRFGAIVYFDKYKSVFTNRKTYGLVAAAFLGSWIVEIIFYNLSDKTTRSFMYTGFTGAVVFSISTLYIVCVVFSVSRIRKMALNARISYMTEIKLLVQAIMIGIAIFAQELLYSITYGGLYYEIAYMLYGGINPLIYLAFNSRLRSAYIQILTVKAKRSRRSVAPMTIHLRQPPRQEGTRRVGWEFSGHNRH